MIGPKSVAAWFFKWGMMGDDHQRGVPWEDHDPIRRAMKEAPYALQVGLGKVKAEVKSEALATWICVTWHPLIAESRRRDKIAYNYWYWRAKLRSAPLPSSVADNVERMAALGYTLVDNHPQHDVAWFDHSTDAESDVHVNAGALACPGLAYPFYIMGRAGRPVGFNCPVAAATCVLLQGKQP